MTDVVRIWVGAVGDQIARNAWPARIARDGTLHVNTSSSAWAFELAQLEAHIRDQLADCAPTRIRFAPGPLPELSLDDPNLPKPAPLEPSAEARAEADRLAAQIGDEELRKLVAKAAAASLSRAASGRPF